MRLPSGIADPRPSHAARCIGYGFPALVPNLDVARWQAGCIGVGGGAVVAGFCSSDSGAGERVILVNR